MTDSPVNTTLQPFFQLFLRRPSDLDREDSQGEKIQEYLGEDTGTEREKTTSHCIPCAIWQNSSGDVPRVGPGEDLFAHEFREVTFLFLIFLLKF